MKRLALAYVIGLFSAFAVVGGANTALYALNIGHYRNLGFMDGFAEAHYGEYQGRLLLILALTFVPLSIFIGIPVAYHLFRKHRTDLWYFALLGAGLGLGPGVLLVPMGKLGWFLFGPLSGVVWAVAFRRVACSYLRNAGDSLKKEVQICGHTAVQTTTAPCSNWIHLPPLLFLISLCLPALHIDANRGDPMTLFGVQAFLFTLFLTDYQGRDLAACLLGVSANILFISSYMSFWLTRVACRSSGWPLGLGTLGAACGLLSPVPVYGHRLDAIYSGYMVWLCAKATMAAIMFKIGPISASHNT